MDPLPPVLRSCDAVSVGVRAIPIVAYAGSSLTAGVVMSKYRFVSKLMRAVVFTVYRKQFRPALPDRFHNQSAAGDKNLLIS